MTFELGLEGWLGFPWEWGEEGPGRKAQDVQLHIRGKLGMCRGGGNY